MSNKKSSPGLSYGQKLEIVNRFSEEKTSVKNLQKLTKSEKSRISRRYNKTVKNNIPPERLAKFAETVRKFETFHSRKKKNFSDKEKAHLVERYEYLKQFNKLNVVKVSAKVKNDMERRGIPVTEKGVLVDQLRDFHGRQIKNTRVSILKSGLIKESVGTRTITVKNKKRKVKGQITYIVSFTEHEKAEFVRDPQNFIKHIVKKYPELRKFKPEDFRTFGSKKRLSLQVGAYGSRRFSLSKLDNYMSEMEDEATAARFDHFLDIITGIRLTEYK